MKRFRFLPFPLAIAVVVFLWPRKPVSEKQPTPARAESAISNVAPPFDASDESSPRENAVVDSTPGNAIDRTLASIRAKLVQLNETPKADKGTEDELMGELLGLLTDENAREITQALSPEELNSRFGLAALQRWLKIDVLAAADCIAARPSATDEQAWAVASRMKEDDVLLASYCARLSDTPWAQLFRKQAVLGSVWRNPEGALRFAQAMNPSDSQRELLQIAACSWVMSNPGPASDWIVRVPDPLLKELLVCAGARTYASVDPMASLSWLIACIPVPSETAESLVEETVRDVMGTWAESNPAQAAQATAQFPSGDLRSATLRLVSRGWLERDPAAASAWIQMLPERDRILQPAENFSR